MYNYIGKEFDRRFIIAGKEVGCSACNSLAAFLKDGLNGEYDDQITNITLESNEKDYYAVIEETQSMGIPILVDLKTGKHMTGFNPPAVVEFLNG